MRNLLFAAGKNPRRNDNAFGTEILVGALFNQHLQDMGEWIRSEIHVQGESFGETFVAGQFDVTGARQHPGDNLVKPGGFKGQHRPGSEVLPSGTIFPASCEGIRPIFIAFPGRM